MGDHLTPEQLDEAAMRLCWSGFSDPKNSGARSARSYWRRVKRNAKEGYLEEVRAAINVLSRAGLIVTTSSAIAEQIATAEDAMRERCAKVCDDLRHPSGCTEESDDWLDATDHCASAIRSTGEDRK